MKNKGEILVGFKSISENESKQLKLQIFEVEKVLESLRTQLKDAENTVSFLTEIESTLKDEDKAPLPPKPIETAPAPVVPVELPGPRFEDGIMVIEETEP